jgi:hypothetical protein
MSASSPSNPSLPPIFPTRKGAIVVLSGVAGVGKTTIATQIHKYLNPEYDDRNDSLPLYATHSSFFHNHLVIDYAQALVSRQDDAAKHMDLRESSLDQALQVMTNDGDQNRIFIITAYATMGVANGQRLRLKEMQKYIDLAAGREVPFLWFHIVCAAEEHKMRVEDHGRNETKIRDYGKLVASIQREEDRMVECPDERLKIGARVTLFSHEEVDTTGKSAEQSAEIIVSRICNKLGTARRS